MTTAKIVRLTQKDGLGNLVLGDVVRISVGGSISLVVYHAKGMDRTGEYHRLLGHDPVVENAIRIYIVDGTNSRVEPAGALYIDIQAVMDVDEIHPDYRQYKILVNDKLGVRN
jgi:hypothetical protein